MLGAIVGDIVGSVYEWDNIKTKDFPLFREDCFFTDDTVMTCAVAEAVMNGGQMDDFIDAMKKYGRMYPDADYGARFDTWIRSENREPYNSFGNGSAMRISPCGWVMDCGFYARTGCWPSRTAALARLSAEVTLITIPKGLRELWQQRMQSFCVGITLVDTVEITDNQSMITLSSVRDVSRNTSRKSMDTTFLKR